MRKDKTYPGYGLWASSELAFSIVFALQAWRGLVSDILSVLLGNVVACCAMVLLVRGIRRFCGQHGGRLWIYTASGAFLSGVLYFYFVSENFRIGTLLAGSYLAVMTAYAGVLLLRPTSNLRRYGYLLTATLLLAGSVVGIVRVLVVATTANVQSLFFHAPINSVFYLTDLVFIIGLRFSFFLLTNQRFVVDLRDSNLALAREVEEPARRECPSF